MRETESVKEWSFVNENVKDRWKHRHTVLVFCAIGYFGVRFIEFALSIVFEDIKSTLGVSSLVIGLAVAASTLTYAAMQLPSGALGDRFGERSVLLWSLGLTGVASLVLAASPSGLFIVFGMAIVGLVSGAYYSPATALLTDLFDEAKTGRAIGIHRLGAQVVGFTAPLVGLIIAAHGWRVVLLLGAAVAVPALVGIGLFVRPRPAHPGQSLGERLSIDTARSLLTRPSIAFTTAIAAFAQFADTAAFSFLPLLLAEFHGLSTELSAALFTGYFVAITVSQPIAGGLADRFGRDPAAVAALLTGAAGFVALAGRRSLPVIIGAVGLVGLGMGWGPPVQSRAMDRLDAAERGAGFGLIRTVYIGLAALNGIVVPGFAMISGWDAGLGVLAVAFLAPAAALSLNHAAGWKL